MRCERRSVWCFYQAFFKYLDLLEFGRTRAARPSQLVDYLLFIVDSRNQTETISHLNVRYSTGLRKTIYVSVNFIRCKCNAQMRDAAVLTLVWRRCDRQRRFRRCFDHRQASVGIY
eukprot:GHVU01038724.1.p2 GENE.GHVU01038724.1~~GHVU01038724.1.p2  ORF type:complete len:116 (+),score=2.79 GHVU01038724.1:8888-9235(+)